MGNNQSNFSQLEKFLTSLLLVDLGIFVLYLMFAGFGVLVLKIITATAAILGAGFCLWILYKSKELRRPRSLWMTCAFGSVALLTIVSLICNYPGPK